MGNVRRQHVLVGLEAAAIRTANAVLTVSEPIADALQSRYSLAERPTVVLNMPVLRDEAATGASVRDRAGVPDGTPLIVYSGSMSRARGLESLVEAMGHVPNAWLALVTVPFPHPMTAELIKRADDTGAGGRVVALPPVVQDELLSFLSGADVGVHPMPGGSPNHDMALPNKLFEYLHAGVTLAVADAKLMASFVQEHGLGQVFRSLDAGDTARALRAALAQRATQAPQDRAALARRFCWQAQEATVQQVYGRLASVPTAGAAIGLACDFPPLDVLAVRA
jgi:glycosyltransferase involved in cell wall biosynthesis